jgi:hypothetical protein
MLVDAAKACGKTAEVTADADKWANEKVENADLFRVLVYLMQGKGKQIEPAVKAYSEAAKKRMTSQPEKPVGSRYYWNYDDQQPPPMFPSEVIFAKLCLAQAGMVPHGERLLMDMLSKASSTHNVGQIAKIREMWDRLGATRAGSPDALDTGLPPGWFSATYRSVWFAQDGYLIAAWNDQPSYLMLDSPLAGSFEFSVDAYQGGWTEGHVGYGGLVCEPNRDNVGSGLWPVGNPGDRVDRKAEGLRPDGFNRFTVRVTPEKVTYQVNGHVYYEDTAPPPTSPWAMLYASGGRRPVFRNFALSGKPEVPAEVKLIAGDYLDGWTNHIYGGTRPSRIKPKEAEKKEDPNKKPQPGMVIPAQQDQSKPEPTYDWWAKNGELFGRKAEAPTGKPLPSKLMYFRPMRPGEEVRYEFFYQPGETQCHPSLGRLAFLLEPDGVKLRWLTDRPEDDWTALKADNAVVETSARRGPEKLALKAGDWNAVKLSLSADSMKIELNGAVVYERPLEPAVERLFGIYHDRDKTGARVRNAVLTGNWPKTIEKPELVGFATKPASPAEAKARRWQLGEQYYFKEAGDIVKRAAALPAAEAYTVLAEWVLPNDSRPNFQMAGVNTAQDVLGVVHKPEQPAGRRVMLGNTFDAPALALVMAAKNAGKLDELSARVEKFQPTDELARRGKSAMLVLVRAGQGKTDEAGKLLKELTAAHAKLDAGVNENERWPELVTAIGTMDAPGLIAETTALLQAMNQKLQDSMLQNKPFNNREWWVRTLRSARSKVLVAGKPANGFAHWDSVPAITSWTRSQGMGLPYWVYENGTVTHHPGHNEDYLALRVPLLGNFEVTAELMLQGWSEGHVMYGAKRIDLNHDRKVIQIVQSARHDTRQVTILPAYPPNQPRNYKYKLAVKDGMFTMSVDGRVLHTERVGTNPDPWLLLHGYYQTTGPLKDVRISGSPVVPDSIDLITDDTLAGWRPYLGGMWSVRGEEMFHGGKRPERGVDFQDDQPEPPRNQPEQSIFYHRPMLEDGVVEYEFYVDPGKCMVHPQLDRLVFLLEPDGVRLHWQTDGPHDRSGVPFDNVTDEPQCRRGPTKLAIKPHTWNRARLEVVGDTVKVSLNGELVYERPIEPTNQRFFGLFHYNDRTEARVRSITMRGDWPKQLPPNEKLFEVRK